MPILPTDHLGTGHRRLLLHLLRSHQLHGRGPEREDRVHTEVATHHLHRAADPAALRSSQDLPA